MIGTTAWIFSLFLPVNPTDYKQISAARPAAGIYKALSLHLCTIDSGLSKIYGKMSQMSVIVELIVKQYIVCATFFIL